MVVTCRTARLDSAQLARVGRGFSASGAARLSAGKTHVVLGMQLEVDSLLWGTGAWIQIAAADAELLVAPLCLFDVVDGRVSAHWEARAWEDGSLTLWPPSFYAEYYRSDLARGMAAPAAYSRRVRVLLAAVAGG